MAYLSDQDPEAEAIQLRNMMGLPLEVPLRVRPEIMVFGPIGGRGA